MLDNEKLRDYEEEKYKEHLYCHKLHLHPGNTSECIWGVFWNGVFWK